MGPFAFRCIAVGLIGLLAACSNGRGSLADPQPPASPGSDDPPTPTVPPPPTPPPPTAPVEVAAATGYWLGTFGRGNNRSQTARALVTGAGEIHFIVASASSLTATSELVIHGNVCCEAEIDAGLKSKEYMEGRESNARFRAEIENGTMSGEVRIRGTDYGFSLQSSARYDESLTLQDLAGTYTRTTTVFLGPTSTYTITIDPSGQVTGSHTNGCVYNGSVAIADPPRNLAKLTLQLSNCPRSITGSGSMNGNYTGLGFLARDTTSPSDSTQRTDVFIHSLVGPTWLGQLAVE